MNATVVLEIGNPWLKMAVFRYAIGTYYLKALSCVDAGSLSEENMSVSIQELLRDLKIKKPQNTIVSFPRNSVTLRNLRIPSANPNEIDDMIKLHVGRQVPYAREEIVSGYRIIGKDTMGYSKVMLAIVHRETIRKVFRILEKAGLYTDRLELSSDGILSWLCKATKAAGSKPQDAFIILDVDSGFTDFIIATYENTVFSRVIALGSESLSDESKWQKFLGEMKQTMVISQGEEISQKPGRVFLTGATENLRPLASKIEMEFNMPTQIIEPLINMPLAKQIEKKPEDLFRVSSVSSVLGLGVDTVSKKINFVLPEAQIRRSLRERSRDMIFLASGIMYVILMICGIYIEKMNNRQAYLDMLDKKKQAVTANTEHLNEKVERIKRIKAKLDTRSSALNYLYEISKLIPPEIVLLNVAIQVDDNVRIKGRSDQMSDVFQFITVLENSRLFKDVATRYTTRKKYKDKDIIEFELTCPIEGVSKEASAKSGKEATEAGVEDGS